MSRATTFVAVSLCAVLTLQGCFDPVYPQLDREARVLEALNVREARPAPPSPLTPARAVAYALANNLDARVSEIETAYHSESAVAAKRRLLPSLTARYNMEHANHPGARWSESSRTGSQSLESSYSSDPNNRHAEVGLVWNLLDFGVGYIKARQQEERVRYSREQHRRVRQQVVLDVLSCYWRAAAAVAVADEAEKMARELEEQRAAIRDSVEMRILSGAEGARRELSVHGGLVELEQWRRAAVQARLELARALGCGSAATLRIEPFPETPPAPPPLPNGDPTALQAAALQRRPELFQQDAQERVAVDDARAALLQMAPNASLSMSLHDDPDKFLEWGNWMTVGARVSWNLFNIPARLSERRMAKLQEETARQKGLALAMAIMAQVGIAYSEWGLSHRHAAILSDRAAARGRLVEALAAAETDGQTRPGEVLQERVRLLSDKAGTYRAMAEAWVAGARLANAIGMDVDGEGRLLWNLDGCETVDLLSHSRAERPAGQPPADAGWTAVAAAPEGLSGLRVIRAEEFEAPAAIFRPTAGPAVATGDTIQMDMGDDLAIGQAPPEQSEPEQPFIPDEAAESAVLGAGTPKTDDIDEADHGDQWTGNPWDSQADKGENGEEIRSMAPRTNGFKDVKNLPLTSFIGPRDLRAAADMEEERRRALAPLESLVPLEESDPLAPVERPAPLSPPTLSGPAEEHGTFDLLERDEPHPAAVRRNVVKPGSLRPPS